MKLHENKEEFLDLILTVSREYRIVPALIEKDYYVTLLLNELNNGIPGLLFKGGTSLAKCYKIINRFSEDIDLTLDKKHFSQSQKRKSNKTIIEVCDKLGFKIANRENVEMHGHGNYNVYNIEYPILFPSDDVKPFLKIEMVFIQKSYPEEMKTADSYIDSYLISKDKEIYAKKFGLKPFLIRTQTLQRTLIDKVFAICDYYLSGQIVRNSRHIYDIHCILTKLELKDESRALIEEIRQERKKNKMCLSAQDNQNINALLRNIIDEETFKKDYINNTERLLIENIKYDNAIKSLKYIIDSKLF